MRTMQWAYVKAMKSKIGKDIKLSCKSYIFQDSKQEEIKNVFITGIKPADKIMITFKI